MAQFLKADTSVDVRIGPFLDVGDGFTPETAVTLTGGGDNADEAELLKVNGAATVDISARTWAAVTGCDGWYDLTLSTSDTDTEGDLTVVIQNDSVHLPVFARFQVVNANVYDSLFAAATTDYLQVDLLQIGGGAQSATDLKDFADAGYDPGTNKVQGVVLVDTTTTNTDLVTAAAIADAVWDEAATGHTDAGKAGQQLWTDVDAILLDTGTDGVVLANDAITAAKIAANAITSSEIADNAITAGKIAADAITAAKIADGAIDAATFAAGAIDAAAIAANAIGASELATDAVNEIRDAIIDAALTQSTYAPQEAPPVNATIAEALAYLYKAWRNRSTQTSTTYSLYADDATTVDQKATVSDNGTTYDKGEVATGAP